MDDQKESWIYVRVWEPIAAFVNDYWWIFAIIVALALILFLTRDIWLPLLLSL